jgi:hypothetical protein
MITTPRTIAGLILQEAGGRRLVTDPEELARYVDSDGKALVALEGLLVTADDLRQRTAIDAVLLWGLDKAA